MSVSHYRRLHRLGAGGTPENRYRSGEALRGALSESDSGRAFGNLFHT